MNKEDNMTPQRHTISILDHEDKEFDKMPENEFFKKDSNITEKYRKTVT